MLVVRIGAETMPSSFSIRPVSRQVRSNPPPGAAPAMHSGFVGWNWAAAVPGARAAASAKAAAANLIIVSSPFVAALPAALR
jgi:hypothetical protein